MQLENIEVTPDFFVPLLPLCKGRPRCGMFLARWQNFMSKIPEDNTDSWMPRILEVVVDDFAETPESVVYSARVATTIAVWFGTNDGREFMESLMLRLNKNLTRDEALSAWAVKNAMATGAHGDGERALHGILQDRNALTSTRPLPLTEVENDTAEMLMAWLSTRDGLRLLSLFRRASKCFSLFDQAKVNQLMQDSMK